jgi:hypothetical protein
VRLHRDPEQLSDALEYDIFILCRVPYSELVGDMLELIEGLGKAAVFGTDESILEPDVELLETLPPEKARRFAQALREQTATLARCPYAIAPTQFLSAWLRERGKTAFVNRVSLSTDMLAVSEEVYAHRPQREPHGPVILGCFNGARSRSSCPRQIVLALEHVLERYSHLELHLGDHPTPSELVRFGHRIRCMPDVSWRERLHLIGAVDIYLAPLDLDDLFCQAVSELKYVEAASVGVPTIASRTAPFEQAITHGENGLLAETMEEWATALELLIEDGDRRVSMGEQARGHVYRRYTPEVRGQELVALLEKIRADCVGQHAQEILPAPERAVIYRLRRHMTRQREQLATRDHQLASLRRAVPLEEETARREAKLQEEIDQLRAKLQEEMDQSEAVLSRVLLWVRNRRRSFSALLWVRGKRLAKSLLRRHDTAQLHGRAIRPGGELVADRTCGQAFIASRPGLCAIEVLFGTYGRLNTPDVTFHLRESPGSGADLATLSVCAALLQDNQSYPFAFEPITDSKDRPFYFQLESPAGVPGDAVSVWIYLDDGSEGCTRYEDGEQEWGQIAYTEGYERDRSWP